MFLGRSFVPQDDKDEKIVFTFYFLFSMSDFPKQYDPKIHEPASQALWEDKKIYQPKVDAGNPKQETFYIPIPPPNVTGNLHL